MEGLQRALMYDGGTLSAPNTSNQETHPVDKVPVCNWEFSGSSVIDKFTGFTKGVSRCKENPGMSERCHLGVDLSVLQRKT